MIPKAHIIQWSELVPWTTYAQVEQDLIISRALVEIFNDDFLSEHLGFRGGTALHKLYLSPQQRYSEDIDLVQLKTGRIRPIIAGIRERISSWLGDDTEVKPTKRSYKRFYKFETEFAPVQQLKLKIEVNTTEHFTVYGQVEFPFKVESDWFKGECDITTYALEELLGTKLRALYQRPKGRDLFDLDHAIEKSKHDLEKIIHCFCEYMLHSTGYIPTTKEFKINLDKKMDDTEFTGDITALLRKETDWNIESAYKNVSDLIEQIDRKRNKYKSKMFSQISKKRTMTKPKKTQRSSESD